MHGHSDVRGTQVQRGISMSCSSSLAGSASVAVGINVPHQAPSPDPSVTLVPSLETGLELKPPRQDSLQQHLFMEN